VTEIATVNPVLAEHANAIRALGRRVTADVIEIGSRLAACRRILKEEGAWRTWLESELRLSPQTAGRFIQIHELSREHSNLEHLDLPVSALYLLAAPSTPETARTEVVKRAEAGEKISFADVRDTIEDARVTEEAVQPSPAPRKRRSRCEMETAHTEHIAATYNTYVDLMVSLLEEQPQKFASAIDRLRDDTIDNLTTLARDPKVQTIIAKVADKLGGRDDIGPNDAGEVVRLQRVNLALESEVAELKAELSHAKGERTALRAEVRELRRAKGDDGLDIPDFLRRDTPAKLGIEGNSPKAA
jgi:hypothetical protein